ncbi:NAD(+)/NADH kinase [Microbacterium sp. KUDC0406]|uniref:ATP-NAD kinase family protein n=1 Tax=Microbacterium sp. KUDC0406 TaxID=2909588 RepID=UPI001F18147A|nr:NAD(+)/NADH kinase [Microbacterium sp. KUDC0406]UJP09272.1 NAD(+)/NADH kinase [Microbacterium sp. KUDC0406]
MIGLVVNPVAGVGGPAGLAGSDGADVQRSARERGAAPRAGLRALTALEVLASRHPGAVIATASGAMGADAVRAAGLVPWVVYDPVSRFESLDVLHLGADSGRLRDSKAATDAADTAAAVAALAAAGCELILVAGGDGTMRDVVRGLTTPFRSQSVPCFGTESGTSCDPDAVIDAPEPRRADESADGGGSGGVAAAARRSVRHLQAADAGETGAGKPDAGETCASDERMPAVLGIPAGVKMYSPVFAVSPRAAGSVASEWLSRGGLPVTEREVLDIDEEQLRRVRVSPTLFGTLPVPVVPGRTQARKAATPASEQAAVEAAARGIVARLEPGVRYLLGPGGTTAEVARILGIRSTALGVDVIRDGELLVSAASEQQLLDEVAQGPAKAVVTVIGGQGFLLGRGNQQLSARVIRALGDDPLLVVAPEQKLIDLGGHPLIVDTGDPDLDARLAGHVRIATGTSTTAFYPVAAPERLYDLPTPDAPPAPVSTFAGVGAEHPQPSRPELRER